MAIRTRRLRNGKTAYDVELRRPDGTKYSKTFHSKREAQAWEAEQRADRARDRWIDPTAGRIGLLPFHDRLVGEVTETSLRVILAVLADPRTDELVSDMLRDNITQIRQTLRDREAADATL